MQKDRRIQGQSRNRFSRGVRLTAASLAALGAAAVAACSVQTDHSASSTTGPAATSGPAAPAPLRAGIARIDPAKIDEGTRVTLVGNTHAGATLANDRGPVAETFPLEHMQLVLKRAPETEATLSAHIDALHDRTAPEYHQWLTAQEFGDQYGVSPADIATVSQWLQSHGMRVDSVPPSRMFLEFSGTAAQVREAFHTEIHHLILEGKSHIGNMSDPEIPAALADVVVGVHSLHDVMPHPMHIDRGAVHRHGGGGWEMTNPSPDLNVVLSGSTYNAIAPPDFATIYNLNPLFAEGITGQGQTIVVIEDTLIKSASDVSTFRTAFGLSAYAGTFSQVTPTGTTTCSNAGVNSAEGEAALDAEWAGAAAPGAAIELAACADTTTVFGGLIAVQNLINGASPPAIMSVSYGECESANGAAANQSYVNAYQQAATLGVSVYVSSGDEGAASCDANRTVATHGIAVSGFASTPYNVAVGGTDFMDTYDANAINSGPPTSTYWSATQTATFGSAVSYIPEIPWNDACTSKLLYTVLGFTQGQGSTGACANATVKTDGFVTTASGSGGPSNYSAQPSWQTGVLGLPTKSGGKRYLPDVSLFAANGVWGHFYVYCLTDTAQGGTTCDYTNATDVNSLAAGGTSFASPAFAGIQALINQSIGGSSGNPNYNFYKLAAAEYGIRGSSRCNSSGGTASSPILPEPGCVFYDVTQGDIDVPCTGATNCFGSSGTGKNAVDGALSSSTTALAPAYAAGTGWDYATGLGTVNAYNLVTEW